MRTLYKTMDAEKRVKLTFVALKREREKWRRRRERLEETIWDLQNSLLTLCLSFPFSLSLNMNETWYEPNLFYSLILEL